MEAKDVIKTTIKKYAINFPDLTEEEVLEALAQEIVDELDEENLTEEENDFAAIGADEVYLDDEPFDQ